MVDFPTTRQEQILGWLSESPSLSIDELVRRLGVSVMTIHRDLDQLVRSGQVEKIHGGVIRADSRTRRTRALQVCRLCDAPVSERTQVIIQTAASEPLYACCPHCGILLMGEVVQPTSILAKDFIYGRMVNALTAYYLVGSSITLCCQPSYLCFGSEGDALNFQKGFGGRIATFDEAKVQLEAEHHHGCGGEHSVG
ncbi:MAG: DeoR family transcriptional regulator [Chloroflexi bacterium]|nr:DeoR family transcriptional regulator [Chloroflexota bacterium]